MHKECFIDGVWYPSATTIIGAKSAPWLDAWREKWGSLATRKMEIAAAIGTSFHDAVEQYLDGKVREIHMDKYPSCKPRVAAMVRSWIAWAESIDGVIDHTELHVISKEHVYSGTLDAVGKIGKKRVIIDWKTGSKIYNEMQLQLVAYAEAYAEQTGIKIKDGLIVHVSKEKPKYKLTTKEFKLGKRPFAEFLKLRNMFDDVQEET